MKTLYKLLLLPGLFFSLYAPAQTIGDGTSATPVLQTRDGSGTLGTTYNQTMCGLGYVQASAFTTTRYSPPGTGLPVTLNIAGIPACATIQQAYLYWIASTSASDPSYTINGTPGNATQIGSGPDKCWNLGGTLHYRGNVTAQVTGNGAYTVNMGMGANPVDGVTLIVIYTDPTATWRGTMYLQDGCIVSNTGGVPTTHTMTGFNACGNGTNVSAFMISGDQQNNTGTGTHDNTHGTATATFPNNFYNFDNLAPTVTAGLNTMNFTTTPASGDCYSIIACGLYFRTTTCGACTGSSALTVNMSQTPDNCAQCNGTATAAVTGGSGTYTYTWAPAPAGGQGTATATGLCAGNYTVTISDGGCNNSTNPITVTATGSPANTTITPAGPFCQSSPAVNLTAATGGGTWSGTGITNASAGTFNPATAGPGTHTITYTIAGACGGSSTTNIVVNPTPTVTVPANSTVCNGANVAASNFTSNPAGGTFSWTNSNTAIGLAASGTGNTPAFTATNGTGAAISGTITVTPTVNGCPGTPNTYTITVNPTPTVTVPANIAVCTGVAVAASNYTSTPAGATFAWTNSNTAIGLGASGAGNTPGFTATNGGGAPITGTITVTPTLAGCTGTPSTYTITVNNTFNSTISPAGPFCESDPAATLTAVDPGGTWSGTGVTNAAAGTFDPNTAGPGTHTITYTIPGACGSTDTENITVNPDMDATITAAGPFCPGDPAVNLTAVDPGGTWSGTGITNAAAGTFDPATAGPGTHTITYTIAGACGDTQTTSIVVSNSLDATISPAGPFCASNPNTFLTAVDPGGTWSGPGIVNAATGEFSPTSAGAGNHTITYSIPGSCGDTQTTTIQVIADADATITPAGPFCTSDPAVTLTGAQTGGVWSGTGITNAALGTFDPATAGAGTHTITYSISGVCGDVQTTNIVVSNQLDATISPVPNLCEQDPSITLTAVDAGGTWSGTGITSAAAGTFDPATAGPGTHTITYTIPGACGDTQTTTITVLPNADATIAAAGPFCTGNTAATLSAADPGGTWSGTGITNAAAGTFDPATAGIGTHTITYTIAGQCGDVNSINIVVVANFDATITPAGPFCENATAVTLSAVDPGGTWSGNGITNAAAGTFDPNTAGPGTHTITYTIPGACGDTQTTNITVNPLPQVVFAGDVLSGCSPVTTNFTNNTALGTPTATWFIDGVQVSADTTGFANTFTVPGCYDITLQTTSAAGCSSSATQTGMVCVFADPVADFMFNPNDATVLNPVIDFTNTSTGASTYVWDFAGLGTSTAVNPSFTFPSTGPNNYTVCLEATSVNGCVDSVCQVIPIYDEFLVYVPNAFTPDNDGINDVLQPIISGHDALKYEFFVFDRWGELIFYSQNSSVPWDGTYKGMMSKQDVYVWKLKARKLSNGDSVEYYGHVSLLK
ncbi:MAG: T9SS type B sorting domain-containing protein [Bacteroidota bacterium]